jgi:L-ascorbate oxidase
MFPVQVSPLQSLPEKNKKKAMSHLNITLILLVSILGLSTVYAEDPYLYFTWRVSYGTISPLGKPQKVIMINKQFPGPVINCTSNNNIVINVFNDIDEPLLFTWSVS